MRPIMLCAALFFCGQASVSIAGDDCGQSQARVERRACLEALMAKTDTEVERVEGQLRSRITLWATDPADIRRSLALFEQDRVAYRAYRQAHCALEASSAVGSSDASDTRIACEADLDRGWIGTIKGALEKFELGD
jgi:uncharacterized protein YecT (DUF1311 family)